MPAERTVLRVENFAPRSPFNPLHYDDGCAFLVGAYGIDRNDVRVLQRAGEPRLAEELQTILRLDPVWSERLYRNLSTHRVLLGHSHQAHSSLSERVLQEELLVLSKGKLGKVLHQPLMCRIE